MTATVGLERLPRSVVAALDEAADNLVATANALDETVHGDAAALAVICDREREGDRVLHDLVTAVGASRRIGPRRAQLLLLGHAIDAVVDTVDELARWWSVSPVADLTDVVLAVRDGARDGGHAVKALEDPVRLRVALDRLHDDADELRRVERAGRARLLVDQTDPGLALRGHGLLECVGEARRACIGLRDRVAACALG